MSEETCPNCGYKHYQTDGCEKCGFKDIKSTTMEEAVLVFCTLCGVHFLDHCPTHNGKALQKVKV